MIAQTNVQLYRQLRDAGFPDEELARARATYELAVELFSGRYRSSHRAFTEHLIGTASVVANVDGRPPMVLAALLHAAYPRGDWGQGPGAAVGAHERDTVRQIVGADAEALIWEFAEIPGTTEDLKVWVDAHLSAPSPRSADIVILALANRVEELFDEAEGEPVPESIRILADAAKDLGAGEVARRLADIAEETGALGMPADLLSGPYPGYMRLPRSVRPLLHLRIGRTVNRLTWRGVKRRLKRLLPG